MTHSSIWSSWNWLIIFNLRPVTACEYIRIRNQAHSSMVFLVLVPRSLIPFAVWTHPHCLGFCPLARLILEPMWHNLIPVTQFFFWPIKLGKNFLFWCVSVLFDFHAKSDTTNNHQNLMKFKPFKSPFSLNSNDNKKLKKRSLEKDRFNFLCFSSRNVC